MKLPQFVLILFAGVLFGVGLTLSGMTDPHRVRAFLDVTGTWDPTLMFVMGGAILAHAPVLWLLRRRGPAAPEGRVDGRLLLGSALFGVGWGISGFCPGPALVSLVAAGMGTLVFVVAMAAGSWLGGPPSVTTVAPADPKII